MGSDIYTYAAYDYAGSAAQISGDGMSFIIGAATADDPAGHAYGSAKVFQWSGTDWVQKGLTLWGQTSPAYFGASVGISGDGNTILVHSPYDHNYARAYVWNQTTLAWEQKGSSVTLGSQLSHGGELDLTPDGNSFVLSDDAGIGYVGVFVWNGNDWSQKGNTINGLNGDRFGHNADISADGNRIVVGAPLNDADGSNTGEIKIFEWNGSSWVQKGQSFHGTLATNFDCCVANFATSMDDSGDTFAYWSTISTSPFAGMLKVFRWETSQWVQKGDDIAGGNGDNNLQNFLELSADGNGICLGFPYDFSFNDGMDNGRVKIYSWNPGLSTQDFTYARPRFYFDSAGDSLVFEKDFSSFSICDISGRLLMQTDVGGNRVNVSGLPEGVYLFKAGYGGTAFTYKFLKK
jgi:hypothetical protein